MRQVAIFILVALSTFGAVAACTSLKELECIARDNTSRPCN